MIFKEEDVGGLEMVTTDEDRVPRIGWTEIKSLASSEDFICERQREIVG